VKRLSTLYLEWLQGISKAGQPRIIAGIAESNESECFEGCASNRWYNEGFLGSVHAEEDLRFGYVGFIDLFDRYFE